MNSPFSVPSPFNSMDVIVVPDDDDEALAHFPRAIVEAATEESVAVRGRNIYVRASLWAKMKPELESLTTLRAQ